ncbi:MAG: hypothetical protein E6J80_13100, partial [Deltaproteobacteria bacterium]
MEVGAHRDDEPVVANSNVVVSNNLLRLGGVKQLLEPLLEFFAQCPQPPPQGAQLRAGFVLEPPAFVEAA